MSRSVYMSFRMVTENPCLAHVWFGNRPQSEITVKIGSSADDTGTATGRNYTGRQNVCPDSLGVLVTYCCNGHNAIMCDYCRINRGGVNG